MRARRVENFHPVLRYLGNWLCQARRDSQALPAPPGGRGLPEADGIGNDLLKAESAEVLFTDAEKLAQDAEDLWSRQTRRGGLVPSPTTAGGGQSPPEPYGSSPHIVLHAPMFDLTLRPCSSRSTFVVSLYPSVDRFTATPSVAFDRCPSSPALVLIC